MWPFRLRYCKWEFGKLLTTIRSLIVRHSRFVDGSSSRVVLEPRCLFMSDEGFKI